MKQLLRGLNRSIQRMLADHVVRRDDVIQRLRHEFQILGFDLSDFSDDDITQTVEHMGEVWRSAGITTEEAAAALRRLLLPAS